MASASALSGGLLSGLGQGMVSQAEQRRQAGLERARELRRQMERKEDRDFQVDRDKAQQSFQTERDLANNKQRLSELEAQHKNRLAEIEATGKETRKTSSIRPDNPPAGYRWTNDGGLEPIAGGPADPEGPAARKVAAPLRKEFRSLESVKALETSLPLIKSAEKAPDTGYGDLQLIYTAGKVLDPGSVVREGELALTVAAGSPLQRIIGKTRFTTEQGGRLTPKTRQQIIEMLNERVGAYQQAYDQDREVYTQYATEAGLDPVTIVGKHPNDAYGRKSPKAEIVRVATPEEAMKLPSGTRFLTPDGREKVRP